MSPAQPPRPTSFNAGYSVKPTPRLPQRDFNKTPSTPLAFALAITLHLLLFAWNPIILSAGEITAVPQITVRYEERLPPKELAPLPPPPKPEEKKPPVKKVKNKLAAQKPPPPKPAPVIEKPLPPAPPTPILKSKIALPKFIPREVDDTIESPSEPTKLIPQIRTQAPVPTGMPSLKGKSRGVHISDVRFKMDEGGDLTGVAKAGSPVVKIPLGQERGDTASLPNAPELHGKAPAMRPRVDVSSVDPELAGKGKAFGGHITVGMGNAPEEPQGVGGVAAGKASTSPFEIGGPVGDRKVMKKIMPEYPEWAQNKGITAVVRIYFSVKADGSVRSTMRIQQSSGYVELDNLAKDALVQWKFSPTAAGAEESWGIITFRFTLN